MSKEAMKLALEAAYLAGFNASGEGYNSEYPFGDHARNPEEDAAWIKDRDNALRKTQAEQPAQGCEFCSHPLYAGTKCKHCGRGPEQPAQQEPVHEFAYKAITKHGHHCHFGTHEAARGWAGEGGEVETIKLRHFELVKTTDTSTQPAQQEPVAWMYQCSADSSGPVLMQNKRDWAESSSGLWTETPLYKSPPASKPLTDEQVTKAALWDLALSKGLITIHSEQLAPGTWSAGLSVASWMEGHTKACDISNEAAHGIKGDA